jgi:DNA invertase Pin-like site-specific DNA recombinase
MAVIKIPAGSHGIVYVRVSTEHQASDELPIASQVAELTAAVERAGATCDVVQDAGISGTDLEGRQGLQSIISRAREGGPSFSWVLVWKFSRFTRNMEEGLVYRALLRKRGIDILSYKEPVPEGPLGSLITHILMAVDEFYAAATAADVLRSQKELARQGFSAGGRPPVGYRREPVVIGARYDGTPLTRVRWVPDPETAPKVVQAFQMAAEGVTYDEIVAATGICENKSSLATILANPIYRGVRVFNREAASRGRARPQAAAEPGRGRRDQRGRSRRSRAALDEGAGDAGPPPEGSVGAAAIRGRLRADGAAPVRVRVADGGHEQSVIPLLPLQGALRSTKRAGERSGCRRYGPDPPDSGDPEGCPGHGPFAQRGLPDARRAACARSR